AMMVTLGSGGGTFAVDGTFAASSPNAFTLNTGTGNEKVTVLASSAPLVFNGGGGQDEILFDASALATPITTAALVQSGTQASLTGFGPIGSTLFSGFQQADVKLGHASNTLTLGLNAAGMALNVDSQQGDDTVIVNSIGDVTTVTGGTGQDT